MSVSRTSRTALSNFADFSFVNIYIMLVGQTMKRSSQTDQIGQTCSISETSSTLLYQDNPHNLIQFQWFILFNQPIKNGR